jgi:hypothetical protein
MFYNNNKRETMNETRETISVIATELLNHERMGLAYAGTLMDYLWNCEVQLEEEHFMEVAKKLQPFFSEPFAFFSKNHNNEHIITVWLGTEVSVEIFAD